LYLEQVFQYAFLADQQFLISHNPNVPASVNRLQMLEKARTDPYPKLTKKSKKEPQPPLSFDIDIRERVPTAEEFSEFLYMLQSSTYTIFLKGSRSESYKSHPTGAQSLYDIVQHDPTAMQWPILVNFETQEIALHQAGSRSMLKTLVREREGKGTKPKVPEPPAPRPRSTPPPKPEAWIDYD
jgi:hypothetical protein